MGGELIKYDALGRVKRVKALQKDRDGFYSTFGNFYGYKGANKKPEYRLFINHDDDDQNMWTEDSLVYKYNKKGDLVNTQRFEVQTGRAPLVLDEDFGKPTEYKYDDKGRIASKIKYTKKDSDPITTKFFYKSGKLFRETHNTGTRTNVFIYYPHGVVKSAKLRATFYPGDFVYNKTGQVTHHNGKKVADFSAYDKYGNWRVRISYDKHGKPEIYTNRVIEYYE